MTTNGRSALVLGAGVGGLTAAHELVERGYKVTVVERKPIPGGKARSVDIPGTAGPGRALPGEHGFRFFPGFYKHLPDTMSRIPYPPGAATHVDDNLAACAEFAMAPGNHEEPIVLPTTRWVDWDALVLLVRQAPRWGVRLSNLRFLLRQLAWLLSFPIDERRRRFGNMSWAEFTQARRRRAGDEAYFQYFVNGPTRALVAAGADEISAFTAGTILCQLFRSMVVRGGHADRVLIGPTNEYWIEPWVADLTSRGVTFEFATEVVGITCAGRGVSGVTVQPTGGSSQTLTANWYVAAVPVERMVGFVRNSPDLAAIDVQLGNLERLNTAWMNGAQFYFDVPLRLVRGHVVYTKSPWALTSVEQQHHWTGDLRDYGTGGVRGILSVDISDWDTDSDRLHKSARSCTEHEILDEVIAQIADHLPPPVHARLRGAFVLHRFLDPDISWSAGAAVNDEPLLINTRGSWENRPQARSRVQNLVLAADYVRTNTDLACMEGANEAARRAVRVILDEDHFVGRPPRIWPLEEFEGTWGRLRKRREGRLPPYPPGTRRFAIGGPRMPTIAPMSIERRLWRL